MATLLSKNKMIILFMSISTVTIFSFQNCSKSNFGTDSTRVLDVCAAGSNCVSSDAFVNTQVGSNYESRSNLTSSGQITSDNVLYNFAAGDKATCESLIQQRLNRSETCSIGGGCGVSCGKPGSNCASANPSLWGACVLGSTVTNSAPQTAPAPTTQTQTTTPSSLYNFVAGDKATCESNIQTRLGRSGTCSLGGGCGASCGAPGGTCASANPTLWGACTDASGQQQVSATASSSSPQSSSCLPAGAVVFDSQNCQGGAMPRVDVQNNTQSWSGCCSGSVGRTCAVTGLSTQNPIKCL